MSNKELNGWLDKHVIFVHGLGEEPKSKETESKEKGEKKPDEKV